MNDENPCRDDNSTSREHANSTRRVLAERPYHSKKAHTKSRLGCVTCKRRKVKCDEARPRCKPCTLRNEHCVYALPSPRAVTEDASASDPDSFTGVEAAKTATSTRNPRAAHPSTSGPRLPDFNLVFQPMYTPAQVDGVEMMLLWFYTTKGFETFSIEAGRQEKIDKILRVDIPQHAFGSPFLMNCLLGLSAMHLRRNGRTDISLTRTVAYRAKTFQGFRRAIEEANPREFPAMLASSLFLCSLSSATFRESDCKALYILDWLMVWRGIALVVELIRPRLLFESGMAVLFMRPPIDIPKGPPRVPGHLLSMISSITEVDDDFPHVRTYHETLVILGCLYLELENDFNPILDLRIISFFTFLPQTFVELARQKQPRALVILAHYLPFTKLIPHIWWMDGIADKEILDIYNCVSGEWHNHLIVPLTARSVNDKVTVARLLLNDPTWETAGDDKYHNNRDERAKELVFIDDKGRKADLISGEWIVEDNAADVRSTPAEFCGRPPMSPTKIPHSSSTSGQGAAESF